MSPAIATDLERPPDPPAAEYVAGIDSSLTKTGVALIGPGWARGVQLSHRRPVGKPKRARAELPPEPTLAERHDCVRAAARSVLDVVGLPTLAVVYDAIGGANVKSTARQDGAALWWEFIGFLVRAGVPVARVMDVSARKAIAGSRPRGESRESAKLATGLAVAKLWPDTDIASDDVADALAAAHLGAVALGWDVPTLARHHDVKWSEWPAELGETPGARIRIEVPA